MSIQKVREYFAQWGMADRVLELDQSSATRLYAVPFIRKADASPNPCRFYWTTGRF